METNEIFKKVGLTKQESVVYLALLELQEAQTGLICKTTNIPSSNIYKILESLIEKGLVSFRLQNNIKVFMPNPPETLNELFFQKQKDLEEERKQITNLITNLKKIEIKKRPQSNYKYFEGISGIKAMWYEINEFMNKDSIINIYTGKKDSYNRLLGFFNEHHKLRKIKKIRERLIFPKEDLELAKTRKDELTETKVMALTNESEWVACKDFFCIFHYPINKKPYGFLIKDPIFAQTFNQVFDQLWEKAEKIYSI